MALNWVFNSVFTHTLVHSADQQQQGSYQNKRGETGQKLSSQANLNAVTAFQMPVHYPRYSKADYSRMEEWRVDMLLRQYGLDRHIQGTLDEKRTFAMGAFLWPDQLLD